MLNARSWLGSDTPVTPGDPFRKPGLSGEDRSVDPLPPRDRTPRPPLESPVFPFPSPDETPAPETPPNPANPPVPVPVSEPAPRLAVRFAGPTVPPADLPE